MKKKLEIEKKRQEKERELKIEKEKEKEKKRIEEQKRIKEEKEKKLTEKKSSGIYIRRNEKTKEKEKEKIELKVNTIPKIDIIKEKFKIQDKKVEYNNNTIRNYHKRITINNKPEEGRKQFTIQKKIIIEAISKNTNRNNTFKKSDSIKDKNTRQITIDRERHLTRQFEIKGKIDLESSKQKTIDDTNNKANIISNNEINNKNVSNTIEEETFKNSIRNKYKRKNKEKNH